MSLIPYNHQEGREIVLRHRNAIVVRDSTSHRIEIRGLTECPTCRRALPRSSSPERSYSNSYDRAHDSYVNPDYFRMLQAETQQSAPPPNPSSPVRRLFKPLRGSSPSSEPSSAEVSRGGQVDERYAYHYVEDEDTDEDEVRNQHHTEFLSSSPGLTQTEGTRIRKQAFSPGYFKTFFKEEKVLGKGGKGVVLLVRHEIDDCDLGYYACKRVPVGDDHAWLEKVLVEVGLLNKLTHPNLVSYRHVWLESFRITRFGPKVACAFILQQYCNGGDLHQYIIGSAPREATKEDLKAQIRRRSKGQAEMPQNMYGASRHLSFEQIYSLFKDITSGVAYLHSNNYIHRDLKPSNCLLHHEGGKLRCLISDFGEVQPENAVRKSTGSTGTISYCAPEVLKQDPSGRFGNFTTKSDIFSLGMILYFMCFGTLPYRSANAIQEELEDIDELRAEISDWRGFQDERRERPDLPPRLYKLLKRLLSLDPAERPSASEVLGAMRPDSISDGLNRSDRPANASLGLQNRVQNLDSPARGGTPVPEPTKRLSRSRTPRGDSSEQSASLVANSSALARSAWVETDDSRQDSSVDAGPSSRGRPLTMSSRQSYNESAVEDISPVEYSAVVDRDTVRSPPLLMAPPRSRLQEVKFRAELAAFYVLSLAGIEHDLLNHLLRMGLFVLKLATLIQPCWPYTIKPQVAIPLILIGALDLRVPEASQAPLAHRNRRGEVRFGPSRMRGLTWSLVLLAFHAAALWLAQRWDSLCVHQAPRDWEQW